MYEDKVYDYEDLSTDERENLKKEILDEGLNNFDYEEYNITEECYDNLVEEIMTEGVYECEDEYLDEDEDEEDDDYVRQQWEEQDEEDMAEYAQNH